MEEQLIPEQAEPEYPMFPDFMAGGRELIFAAGMLLIGILMCNFCLYGGFNLGFSLMAVASILWSWLYIRRCGKKFGGYEKTLLLFSLVIALGFLRSSDGFVKFVMLLFLFVAVNLSFAIGAGQNRRDPNGAASLLDAPRAFYVLGVGTLGKNGRGLRSGIRQGGETSRRFGAVGTGLLIALPLVAVMISLLMSADAAFEGLMDLLPEIELEEYLMSAIWGSVLAWILYSRGVSLVRSLKPMAQPTHKGANALTVNTVLILVCLTYCVYLFSQLAYLSGGLAGILPEEYTLAEYARRGFFEMAWLCVINLSILCGAMWLIKEKLPRITKIAGTFLGIITIFLVVTASAKMFLYIGSYGLTRLRVLTEVIMLWLAITTVLVTIRLFAPIPYMKAVVLTAMTLGTLVLWLDVNSLVANYNVNAYRSGKLETIDVSHLRELGAPAVEYLVELTGDDDPETAKKARDILDRAYIRLDDFREWNYEAARAEQILTDYKSGKGSS